MLIMLSLETKGIVKDDQKLLIHKQSAQSYKLSNSYLQKLGSVLFHRLATLQQQNCVSVWRYEINTVLKPIFFMERR
jgi:S-adenosylmethionine synthetase